MDARQLTTRLCELIDSHRWGELSSLLHDDFVCRYVHTGESFDGETWVRLNAEYPGFEHLVVEDLVCSETRAVARCHVTSRGDGHVQHFQVASFVTVREGSISELTEVWTDTTQKPDETSRPR
ncbi:MAG: nuclear transport factor 2 family protein [Nocardioides sp.]